MRPRPGTEPVTARSDLRLRLVLNRIFVPLFGVATVLFAWWTVAASGDTAPSSGSLLVLTLICAGLTLFALGDLVIVRRRLRTVREEGDGGDARDEG